MKELILNEEKLIENCIAKQRSAQETLYNRYYREMYLIAIRYLSDHQLAEDALIISFTKVFKNLKSFQFKGEGSLGKWIRTILIHEAIRLLNKQKSLQFEDESELKVLSSSAANGLEQIQANDIHRMIEKLPTGYRTIFNLYVIEGYQHKEIAEQLNISENTSKTQLKKARTALMNQLKKHQSYGT